MYRLLILCTGNTCRSPMLEAFVKAELKERGKSIEVKSAGLYIVENSKVEPNARAAVKEYGLVIRHKPTQLVQHALERADTVLAMTDQIKGQLSTNICYYKVFSMREAVGANIPDPYGCQLAVYRQVAATLKSAAKIIVDNLEKAGKI